jgi:hypothetical protein
MTNPNKTSITVVLDKSGSMHPVRADTVGGFNSFVEAQKKLPGECEISLVQFNEESTFTYKSKNIQELKEGVSLDAYNPDGNTALLDAVGVAITQKGKELSELKEEDRPSKVMFVIITDGAENSSKSFTREQIKTMIEHQKNVYNWDFTFLGANIDTEETAGQIGIASNKALSFSTRSKGGANRAFAAATSYASSLRACTSNDNSQIGYTDADRTSNSI